MAEPTMLFTTKILNDYRKFGVRGHRTPGSTLEEALRKGVRDFVTELKRDYIKNTMTSGKTRPGGAWVGKRSGELRNRTTGVVTRTSEYGVTGKIVIGEGLPYTKLHVGTMGRQKHTYGTQGVFTIKLPVGTPWTSPKGVEGLFRGSAKNKLSPKILWKVVGGKPKPMYIMTKSIKIPQRVQTDELVDVQGQKLMYTIRQAFGDLDVTSLAKQVSGGIYEGGAFQ